eukprot:c12111_g1_i1.p1 GENE.c12111_g1_i1~~c12111_g1_i1.p1  ORF type:complete len:677 (-),score=170.10 c12111_g1_i1:1812-3842(-)
MSEVSPHLQRLRDAIAEVESARNRYKEACAKGKVSDQVVVFARQRLRDSFVTLIGTDIRYAVKHDVEVNMWRSVFYHAIESHRAQMSEPAKRSGKKKRQAEMEAEVQQFLNESIEFYQSRVQYYQRAYNLRLTVAEFLRLNHACSLWNTNDLKLLSDEHLAVLCCHRCYICLGDLARYREKFKAPDAWGNPAQHDWSQMQAFYHKALKVLPINGNPFNQFGVLAFDLGHHANALYHYSRAVAVTHPFLNALKNLERLFETNMNMFAKMFPSGDALENAASAVHEDLVKLWGTASHEERSAVRPSFTGSSLAELLIAFVHVHALLHRNVRGEELEVVSEYVCQATKRMLSMECVDEVLLGNLIVCNIFAVHNTARFDQNNGEGEPENIIGNDTTTTSKDPHVRMFVEVNMASERVQSALCFALDFAAACMTTKRKYRRRIPPISMFMSWLKHQTCALECLCMTKPDITCRSNFLKAVCTFCNKVIQDNERHPPVQSASGGSVAVPEDVEMLGFLPLSHMHSDLTPAICSSLTVVGAVDHSRYRLARLDRLRHACSVFCDTSRGGKLSSRKLLCLNPHTNLYTVRPRGDRRRRRRGGRKDSDSRVRSRVREHEGDAEGGRDGRRNLGTSPPSTASNQQSRNNRNSRNKRKNNNNDNNKTKNQSTKQTNTNEKRWKVFR